MGRGRGREEGGLNFISTGFTSDLPEELLESVVMPKKRQRAEERLCTTVVSSPQITALDIHYLHFPPKRLLAVTFQTFKNIHLFVKLCEMLEVTTLQFAVNFQNKTLKVRRPYRCFSKIQISLVCVCVQKKLWCTVFGGGS